MSGLGPKAMACLRVAEMMGVGRPDEWRARYSAACEEFTENAICAKFDVLARRGYIEYGVSPRMGWLTDNGRSALTPADPETQEP